MDKLGKISFKPYKGVSSNTELTNKEAFENRFKPYKGVSSNMS